MYSRTPPTGPSRHRRRVRLCGGGPTAALVSGLAAVCLLVAAPQPHPGYVTGSHNRACTDAVTSANLWNAQGNDMARSGSTAEARRAWGMAESIVGAANSQHNCGIHTAKAGSSADYPAGVAYFIRSGPA
ncbi:hypothetical protein G4X40_22415 [Rhodococcus sp. D2-41]|uniref:hypothetical protein n=1 Tax=Speluncibacter jeojiensis TaxID=2710754 RepID=UPI00240F63D1|nr:hypothetical protein [Rhodococcus sp. D2-41]MDG3012895.1 hypothetical protein [Rhodococcus sp. D2-41]